MRPQSHQGYHLQVGHHQGKGAAEEELEVPLVSRGYAASSQTFKKPKTSFQTIKQENINKKAGLPTSVLPLHWTMGDFQNMGCQGRAWAKDRNPVTTDCRPAGAYIQTMLHRRQLSTEHSLLLLRQVKHSCIITYNKDLPLSADKVFSEAAETRRPSATSSPTY